MKWASIYVGVGRPDHCLTVKAARKREKERGLIRSSVADAIIGVAMRWWNAIV